MVALVEVFAVEALEVVLFFVLAAVFVEDAFLEEVFPAVDFAAELLAAVDLEEPAFVVVFAIIFNFLILICCELVFWFYQNLYQSA
ncbi:hypothetical protein LDL59_03905 [Kaistella anthropi]|nr:hypothetical protein [Kaistella anthropi]